MTSTRLGLLAVVCAAAVIWAIPAASSGKSLNLRQTGEALKQTTSGVVNKVETNVNKTVTKTNTALRKAVTKSTAKKSKTTQRAVASDPKTQPPMHGTDPHGQGGVAIVDTNPSNQRPLGALPNGSDSEEDAIVGRARGEKVNGAYHGHITILALLGSELAGVDSKPGESKTGPLDGIQKGVLDPLCQSTNGEVCVSVLVANSTTTGNKTENDFAVARASALGIGVGAAESKGSITEDANCQAAVGTSKTANVTSPGGGAVAQVANSTSTSQSCRGAAPVQKNTSSVIGLGGTQVPLPAPGCANGTPDTVTGIPAILPIVCNAEDVAGAAGVREALDVYVLQVGGTSLAKETTAASESFTVAPPAAATTPTEATKKQCSDGVDNDGDGVIDAADPGCHSDGNAKNRASYNPNDDDETDRKKTTGSGGNDTPQCSDGVDNDGDGRVDARDGGCHTDGNPNNDSSYDPSDDDESGGATGGNAGTGDNGNGASANTLPFTGTDLVGLTMAGLLLLAGGLLLRRREGTHAPQ